MSEQFREEFEKADIFANHCGMRLIKAEGGCAEAEMDAKSFHKNGVGMVHGGAIFSLADFCFAAASNSDGNLAVAVNANISFINRADEGMIYASARRLATNPKMSSYLVELKQNDKIIAVFQGMAYHKTQR